MKFHKTTKAPGEGPAVSVAARVEARAAEAAALAGVAGQDRLADPWTNPAVREHADGLRDEQQRRALDAQHARMVRRHRVTDRRAEHAEAALAAVQAARQASSPARSVLALQQGRRLWLRVGMAASLVLATGSARGVEAAAAELGAPTGTGYAAEIGLTGLTTAVILYRAHLAEHGGRPQGWQNRVMWAFMVVPLLVSVAANAFKAGPVGVACSLGAAAFAVFGYIVGEQSNTAMRQRAAEVTDDDEAELLSIAQGDDVFPAPTQTPAPPTGSDGADGSGGDEISGYAATGARALSVWLADQDPPDGAAPAAVPPTGPADGGGAAPSAAGDGVGGHIVGAAGDGAPDGADRIGGDLPGLGAARVLAAAQARRAVGASTQGRIAAYLADHPGACNAEVAAELELSRSTVKRHRRTLRVLPGETGGR